MKTYDDKLKGDIKEAIDKKASNQLTKNVVVQMDADNIERKKR